MAVSLTSSATREQFQAAIDIAADGDVIDLNAFEFQGPIHISKPLTLHGTGATIWAHGGPTLTISSKGVRLQNLRLEITGDDAVGHHLEGCALEIINDVTVILDNVTVRGRVKGLASEEGAWLYPLSLSLGGLAPGKEHSCRLHVYVPVPCDIISEIYGVEATPHRLVIGKNEVVLSVDPHLPRDTFMSGYITLITPYVKRQIAVSARILRDVQPNAIDSDTVVYTPDGWDKLGAVPPPKAEKLIEVKNPSSQPAVPPPPVYPDPAIAPKSGPALPPRTSDRRRFTDTSMPVNPLFSSPVASDTSPQETVPVPPPSTPKTPKHASTPVSSIFSGPAPSQDELDPNNTVPATSNSSATLPPIKPVHKADPVSKPKSTPISLPSLFSSPVQSAKEESIPVDIPSVNTKSLDLTKTNIGKTEQVPKPRRIQPARPSNLFIDHPNPQKPE